MTLSVCVLFLVVSTLAQADMAFVVCYRGGVAIRTEPNVDAPRAGEVLEWDEVRCAVRYCSGPVLAGCC